ncbi:MAG: hypothetical protein L3K26_05205 [Candidatus Hydrogenedentes bacterium]|nr:hypothetical protein [Candidatus Hydrogenedentota bacterium]
MKRRKKNDRMAATIERVLNLGHFVPYECSWEFTDDLYRVKKERDALVAEGESERAVSLYELFLAGCYEKAEEIDDSGGSLGDFFESLFISWVEARQKAGCAAAETVQQVLHWMENDDYGFCYKVEEEVAKVLNKEGFILFQGHFQKQLDTALAPFKDEVSKPLLDYPSEAVLSARTLKAIHLARKDLRAYLALCESFSLSPRDCEKIAALYKGNRKYGDALEWVERGFSLAQEREWKNESSRLLESMKQELLRKVGRTDEALQSVWTQFEKHPSVYGYSDLLKYAPKKERAHWHAKAMEAARQNSLSEFIEICVKTKEWEALSEHLDSIERTTLEALTHYVTEKAAKGLKRKHPLVAAKVYAALGMRIVKSGKSKYYTHALSNLRDAKKLGEKARHPEVWLALVEEVRKDHSRKHSFIGDFEEIAADRPASVPDSFEKRARKRLKKQVSK